MALYLFKHVFIINYLKKKKIYNFIIISFKNALNLKKFQTFQTIIPSYFSYIR